MEPLNTKERNNALVRFIVLSTVTILIVLIAAYFDQVFNSRSVDYNTHRVKELEQELKASSGFVGLVDEIKTNMNKMATTESDLEMQEANGAMGSLLATFKNKVNELDTNSIQFRMNTKFYLMFKDYATDLESYKKNIEALNKKNEKLAEDRDKWKEDHNTLEKAFNEYKVNHP